MLWSLGGGQAQSWTKAKVQKEKPSIFNENLWQQDTSIQDTVWTLLFNNYKHDYCSILNIMKTELEHYEHYYLTTMNTINVQFGTS